MAFSSAIVALLTVTVLFPAVQGYSTGAPPGACTEMYPNHRMNHENASLPDERYTSQNRSTAPYSITASVMGNGKVKVMLRTNPSTKYWEGVLLQARLQGTDAPVGMWEGITDTNIQTRDCPGGTKNAITHKSEKKTYTLDVTWIPPASPANMTVVFRATFVEEFEEFWVGLESQAYPVNAYVSAGVPMRALTTVLTGTALLATIALMF